MQGELIHPRCCTRSRILRQDSPDQSACGGQEVAIRISFANFSFFSLHLLATLFIRSGDDWRVELHGGLWLWKTILWLGTLIGFFFVPSNVLYGYGQVARIGSGFYLVIQLVLLIHFVYVVNEWLLARDAKWSWALLFGGTFVGFSLGLLLVGISYFFFAPSGSCSTNLFFITWRVMMTCKIGSFLRQLLLMPPFLNLPQESGHPRGPHRGAVCAKQSADGGADDECRGVPVLQVRACHVHSVATVLLDRTLTQCN